MLIVLGSTLWNFLDSGYLTLLVPVISWPVFGQITRTALRNIFHKTRANIINPMLAYGVKVEVGASVSIIQ